MTQISQHVVDDNDNDNDDASPPTGERQRCLDLLDKIAEDCARSEGTAEQQSAGEQRAAGILDRMSRQYVRTVRAFKIYAATEPLSGSSKAQMALVTALLRAVYDPSEKDKVGAIDADLAELNWFREVSQPREESSSSTRRRRRRRRR